MAEMGRPPVFTDPDAFEASALAYFDLCESKDKVPTVNGLALALGFNSRQSLLNYAEKDDFLDCVKRVRARLESIWEERLAGPNAAGTIFWLKNQGWSDVVKTELTGADGGAVRHDVAVALAPDEAYRRMLDGG